MLNAVPVSPSVSDYIFAVLFRSVSLTTSHSHFPPKSCSCYFVLVFAVSPLAKTVKFKAVLPDPRQPGFENTVSAVAFKHISIAM